MADGRHSSPTRSVYLELKEERDLIREGYEFLDEKRMIVAQELLRRLRRWQTLRDEYLALYTDAVAALAAAVARHGLDGLMVYPRTPVSDWSPSFATRRFLGVELLECDGADLPVEPSAQPVLVSLEAEQCRARHAALIRLTARLAAAHANMERLIAEYVRTERRARALENVLLPEIEETLRFVDDQLEGVDQEEVLRSRFTGRHRAA
jgi:V/A-type H+-transporting ATPase subunit D